MLCASLLAEASALEEVLGATSFSEEEALSLLEELEVSLFASEPEAASDLDSAFDSLAEVLWLSLVEALALSAWDELAASLVLEALDHARARGATIYGEIVGFATNCDAAHITQPQRETMQVCMEQSLAMAGLGPQDIGYISAHGTATDRGDIAESQATAAIFGDRVPISSLKSYFGHTLGACGALEALLSLHMMREGWFTPTLNLRQPDEQCGALDYIMGETRPIDCEFIQSNNFAFGGINTSIIIKRWA